MHGAVVSYSDYRMLTLSTDKPLLSNLEKGNMVAAWVKKFKIIPEFRILSLTFYGK